MDLLAGDILEDLKTHPSEWIADVRIHKTELIESFYLTSIDKPKVSTNILEIFLITFLFLYVFSIFHVIIYF